MQANRIAPSAVSDDLRFEWSAEKARTNLAKHGVSFEEATTVFFDDLARLTNDPDHSIGEQRLLIFGHAATGRLLLVNFVDREGSIRIISAREATKNERKQYEETIL